MANKPVKSNLDLLQNQLINTALERTTSEGSRSESEIWYNTTGDVVKYQDGSGVKTVATTADISAVTLEDVRSVDNQLSGDIDANSNTITNLKTPANSGDAANKAYVDASVLNIDLKDPVRFAVGSNVDLSSALVNGASLGGVTAATGDRALVYGQTDASENGIYVVAASGAASRATDADSDAEVTYGMKTYIISGDDAGQQAVLTTSGAITLDTTDLAFSVSSYGSYTAGDGINITGDAIIANASDLAGAGIEDDGSNNLRISAAAAGNGLIGGAGSALAVQADSTTSDTNVALAINVSSNGVGVKIDGSTIDENGSNQLFVPTGGIGATQLASNAVTTVKITDGNVTYAKIQDVSAQYKLLGRSSAGAGSVEEITTTAFGLTLLDDSDAATARGTLGAAASGANTDITSVLLDQTGLVVKGGDANALTIKPNETLTGGKTLNIIVNDTDRTINLSGNLVVGGSTTISSYANTFLNTANESAFKAAVNLEIGTDVQAYDAQLGDLAGLTPSDGGFIVGDGSNFVIESGATARASLGVAGKYTADFNNTTDWSGSGPYTITIAAGTHGLGSTKAIMVQVFEDGTPNTNVEIAYTVSDTGEVIITSDSAKFAGHYVLIG